MAKEALKAGERVGMRQAELLGYKNTLELVVAFTVWAPIWAWWYQRTLSNLIIVPSQFACGVGSLAPSLVPRNEALGS